MKIGVELLPQFGPPPPLKGRTTGESASLASGFEQLLEAMRAGMEDQVSRPCAPAAGGFELLLETPRIGPLPQAGEVDRHAAKLDPDIGSLPQSFENACLVVEISFDLARWKVPDVAPSVPNQPPGPDCELHIARSREAGRLANPTGAGAPEAGTPPPLQRSNSTAPVAVGVPAAARAATVHAAHDGTALAAPFAKEAPNPRIPRRVPAPPVRTPAESPHGQQSRFAAQLLAAEGGLRVMLRLPQLSEAERGELELRLGQLLESFGYRQREIVIQEIATA